MPIFSQLSSGGGGRGRGFGFGRPFSVPPGLFVMEGVVRFNPGGEGRSGASATAMRNAIQSANKSEWQNTYYSISQNGYGNFTLPYTGRYRIRAVGATAGRNGGGVGGRGAIMEGEFDLEQGQILKITAGHGGQNQSDQQCNTGAGGLSFVGLNSNTSGGDNIAMASSYRTPTTYVMPLVVAGGGGGCGGTSGGQGNSGRDGLDGVTTRTGGASTSGEAGGTGTNGGDQGQGASGAGLTGDGNVASWGNSVTGGQNWISGGQGGSGGTNHNPSIDGGFGGGAGGHGNCYVGGPGGGGYAGGGGAQSGHKGGGGGSYLGLLGANPGSSNGQINGANTWNGYSIATLGYNDYSTQSTDGTWGPGGYVEIEFVG